MNCRSWQFSWWMSSVGILTNKFNGCQFGNIKLVLCRYYASWRGELHETRVYQRLSEVPEKLVTLAILCELSPLCSWPASGQFNFSFSQPFYNNGRQHFSQSLNTGSTWVGKLFGRSRVTTGFTGIHQYRIRHCFPSIYLLLVTAKQFFLCSIKIGMTACES